MKNNRIYVFIDASNLWQAQKAKGHFFDYSKLMNYIKINFEGDKIKAFYYTAFPGDGTRPYSLNGKFKFFTFLSRGLGFIVRKKKLKQIKVINENGEHIEEKGNMDVEMTIDAVQYINQYDTAVLFTGDSDFLALVSYLRLAKKRVYIFSTKNNASEELKTGGDGYTDVLSIQENVWGRKLKYRESKE